MPTEVTAPVAAMRKCCRRQVAVGLSLPPLVRHLLSSRAAALDFPRVTRPSIRAHREQAVDSAGSFQEVLRRLSR